MLLANENTKHKPHETEDLSGEDWKKKMGQKPLYYTFLETALMEDALLWLYLFINYRGAGCSFLSDGVQQCLGAMCQSNIHKNASIHSVSAKHCIVVTLFTWYPDVMWWLRGALKNFLKNK